MFPNRALIQRAAHLNGLVHISHKIPLKTPLKKEIYPFSQGP
jgi:hypothetical protein